MDIGATLLGRRLGILEDHEEDDEDNEVDDELGDGVFENSFLICNHNLLILALYRKLDSHHFVSEVRAIPVRAPALLLLSQLDSWLHLEAMNVIPSS